MGSKWFSILYGLWVGARFSSFHLNLALFVSLIIYWLKSGLGSTNHFVIINKLLKINVKY